MQKKPKIGFLNQRQCYAYGGQRGREHEAASARERHN